MEKRKELAINNKRFLATKRVRLNDKVYQEYWSANVSDVDVVYIDESTNELAEGEIFMALVNKFCITSDNNIIV